MSVQILEAITMCAPDVFVDSILLLLLLNCHRCLRMIPEALELRMEDGWVSLWMCVVSHGYGGLGGGMDGGGGWHACGTKPRGLDTCRALLVRGDKLMTPPSRCAALGMAESESVGFPGKALARDATRRLRFVVHAAGWLHSMMLHGYRVNVYVYPR